MGSCFFIGHRETPDQVYPALLETIEHHITEYGVAEFVVGQYGNFDRLVIRALSQAKRAHPDITLMLMTPYYPVNRKVDLPEAFDALFYPPDLEAGVCWDWKEKGKNPHHKFGGGANPSSKENR